MTPAADITPTNPPGLRDIPFELPAKSPQEKRRAKRIYDDLLERYPDAHCELTHSKPHELLVATILSAQTTDVNVNKATPALFKAFPRPADYAKATPDDIEPYVRSLGFFRNKAKSVHAAMTAVTNDFGGSVPRTMDELLTLRGVARKTANVVLGNAFNTNVGVTVDTHVMRLTRLYALVPENAGPEETERHLMALFPRDTWCMLSHLLIFHGRRASTARTKPEDDPIFVKHAQGVTPPKPTKKKRTTKKKTNAKKRSAKKKTAKKKATSKKAASKASPRKKNPAQKKALRRKAGRR